VSPRARALRDQPNDTLLSQVPVELAMTLVYVVLSAALPPA
jgi:hypothetical protein